MKGWKANLLDWKKWAEFEGYGYPLSDSFAGRMRDLVLHCSVVDRSIRRLDYLLQQAKNAAALKYTKHWATLEGTEAYKEAACKAHVAEDECAVRLLDARLRAAKRAAELTEKAWETERSHGSGAKEEARHTQASAA